MGGEDRGGTLLGRLIIQNNSNKLQKWSAKNEMIFSGASTRWDVMQDSSDAYLQDKEQLTSALSWERDGKYLWMKKKTSENQHFMLLQSRKTWCWVAETQVQLVMYIQ